MREMHSIQYAIVTYSITLNPVKYWMIEEIALTPYALKGNREEVGYWQEAGSSGFILHFLKACI